MSAHGIEINAEGAEADGRATTGAPEVVLGMATAGRPKIAARTLSRLALQSRLPDRVVVCVPSEDDLDKGGLSGLGSLSVVTGRRGLTKQRNGILDAVDDHTIILFIDDDFVMAEDYLERAVDLFARRPDIAVATGVLLADGIHGPGIGYDEAVAMVSDLGSPGDEVLTDYFSGYGCNMAIRMAAARKVGATFNERLPAYGWLEDVDFCRQLLPVGRIIRSNQLRGVHLGSKSGRQPGVRLGYSQIANPVHLMKRRTMGPMAAFHHMGRNVAANTAKSIKPEPWIDRTGRLRGNLIALGDLARGRLDPERIDDLG